MIDKLLELLDIDDDKEFRLRIIEAIGNLVLMLHWQRGIIDAAVNSGGIALLGQDLENWKRVIDDLELYEEFTWEIAPSRAMLLQLRAMRFNKEPEEGFELLNKGDSHGRIPYHLHTAELDDIEDILRKLKDARQLTGFGHGKNL